jgi:hypothetical protein
MASATTILWMPEFRSWYDGLSPEQRAVLDYSLALLADHGPMLAMPHAKKVKGAAESIIELRVQTRAFAIRAFYAFNPRREAVMIIGGDKKGVADENTWTAAMAKRAGKTWDAYLRASGWRR